MERTGIKLDQLSVPFSSEDVEWRVSRAGMGNKGIFCMVLAYVTARAIQKRFDEACGPENWRNEEPRILTINNKSAFACGLSIRLDGEWVTKWDVAEPTNIEPAKGGWSGAMKRAGAQWGVGRYLYALDEGFAEVAESMPKFSGREWNYAKLPEKAGGGIYYWKPPALPAWALPKDPEHEITGAELTGLKQDWRAKFAPDAKNPKDLREGFERFVHSVCGQFPVNDYTFWTRDAYDRCLAKIASATDASEPGGDVPFDSETEAE